MNRCKYQLKHKKKKRNPKRDYGAEKYDNWNKKS